MQMKAVVTQEMSVIMLRICGECNSTYNITLRACVCYILVESKFPYKDLNQNHFYLSSTSVQAIYLGAGVTENTIHIIYTICNIQSLYPIYTIYNNLWYTVICIKQNNLQLTSVGVMYNYSEVLNVIADRLLRWDVRRVLVQEHYGLGKDLCKCWLFWVLITLTLCLQVRQVWNDFPWVFPQSVGIQACEMGTSVQAPSVLYEYMMNDPVMAEAEWTSSIYDNPDFLKCHTKCIVHYGSLVLLPHFKSCWQTVPRNFRKSMLLTAEPCISKGRNGSVLPYNQLPSPKYFLHSSPGCWLCTMTTDEIKTKEEPTLKHSFILATDLAPL